MASIKDDLDTFGIKMDKFSYESDLIKSDKVTEVIDILDKKGYVYKGYLEKPSSENTEYWKK